MLVDLPAHVNLPRVERELRELRVLAECLGKCKLSRRRDCDELVSELELAQHARFGRIAHHLREGEHAVRTDLVALDVERGQRRAPTLEHAGQRHGCAVVEACAGELKGVHTGVALKGAHQAGALVSRQRSDVRVRVGAEDGRLALISGDPRHFRVDVEPRATGHRGHTRSDSWLLTSTGVEHLEEGACDPAARTPWACAL
mmetsp:Transcript_10238/g.26608  ORF Transcript_10238/g.26608 Transcript_10238/m.26608 type:complete len:201 (-) Transcript_10238:2-604(-)